MLESLEQLRGMRGNYATYEDLVMRCYDIADEIEREVKERYIELPKDADGEPIHIGDEMDCGEHFGIQEVEGFIHGAVAFTVCDPQPARICTCPAHMTHHYHAPTVEDVLNEFASERIKLFLRMPVSMSEEGIREFQEENSKACEKLIAEYAAKIRLADNGEEQ